MTVKIAAITGAGSAIGKYIISALVDQGWHIRVLSISQSQSADSEYITTIHGDIADSIALTSLLHNANILFHCAAEVNDEAKMQHTNVEGTRSIVRHLANSNVRYFCHISSSGVVGPRASGIVAEDEPCNPENYYETTKYEAERIIISAELNMAVRILRPTNVVSSLNPGILSQVLQGGWRSELSRFIKSGEFLHVIHAKNVADAATFNIDSTTPGADIYFVSHDHDERNYMAWLAFYCKNSCKPDHVFVLPKIIPKLIRWIALGRGLRSEARFSSDRLFSAGCNYSYSLEQTIDEVCRTQS